MENTHTAMTLILEPMHPGPQRKYSQSSPSGILALVVLLMWCLQAVCGPQARNYIKRPHAASLNIYPASVCTITFGQK